MSEAEDNLPTTERSERIRFFLQNLAKGLVWLTVIVGGYFYLKQHFNFTLEDVLGSFYDRPDIIFSIFFVSEAVFGIIPPELFMLWSLRDEVLKLYILNVTALASISYMAGVMGYFIGSHFSTTKIYRLLRRNYLGRLDKHLNRFGGFLIIVAAWTPLPFSGVCMLIGAVKYPAKRFLIISLSRFLRYATYAAIIWEANILQ
ncbi:YqaA family protein [Marinoscillum sp. MHG1-6]|uniref:YqaA family protein n=1 Tax=Marinoscillum sp. MHG1-6 TaxID=2959627 RepID=UPI002158156D|nr:VTT domain-containing protein [Marinoscillum sp. MHG1-6]